MYVNKVELIGFLGRDAESKTAPNGNPVTTFSLASKTSYMKDGNRKERTEWHRISKHCAVRHELSLPVRAVITSVLRAESPYGVSIGFSAR
jgi:single stranded DNA-binding protein